MELKEFVAEMARRRSAGEAEFAVPSDEAFKESCLGLACV